MAEIYRAGILDVDKREIEAAYSLGLTSSQVFSKIVFPQAIRTIIPEMLNQIIMSTKTATIASVIGVHEILYRAQVAATFSMRPLEIYSFVAIIYFVLCYSISILFQFVERRVTLHRA